MLTKSKIRKNDTVEVIAGKDKGKRGEVVRVDLKKERVVVSGVNIVKKAMKKKSQQDQGGIAEIEAPLNISNVAIVCKKCGPTRIGYKLDGDKKTRVCRKCGEKLYWIITYHGLRKSIRKQSPLNSSKKWVTHLQCRFQLLKK